MYGPAARCKRFRQPGRLRSCINVSGLSLERVVLRAIMDISAPAVSLARTGHLGHQGSQAPGRPVLHFVSSSRRPRQENVDYVIALSLINVSSLVRAVRPFLRPGLQVVRGIARRGRQGWPSGCLCSSSSVCRPRLDGPEHGATLMQAGPKAQ